MKIIADSMEARRLAAEALSNGEVVAFRTDTFYGLGADPFNHGAIERIRALKGREESKPILLIIDDASRAERFIVRETEIFSALAHVFWPGALTLVAAAREELPTLLTALTGAIGLRVPGDQGVREFVRHCGGGALTATSANPAGRPPAKTAQEVADYFSKGLALIIDGGDARAEQPSTVVDVSGDSARLLREGVIRWEDVREALGFKS